MSGHLPWFVHAGNADGHLTSFAAHHAEVSAARGTAANTSIPTRYCTATVADKSLRETPEHTANTAKTARTGRRGYLPNATSSGLFRDSVVPRRG